MSRKTRKRHNNKPLRDIGGLLIGELIHKDRDGRFLAMCDYGWHQQVMPDYHKCEERQCDHFYKLYIKREDGTNNRRRL